MGISRCKLSKTKQLRLIELFVAEVTARTAADLVGVHYHTAHLFYHKLRQLITEKLHEDQPLDGEIEVDESYFGGVRKGKRGRGAAGKVPVFGLLKRQTKVYAMMVENTKTATLWPILQQKIKPESIVYTDAYPSYDILDVSEFHHIRINHSQEFGSCTRHINGIENFWNQAKRVLRKYNGIPKKNFNLFLQECVFRFNYGSPKQQLNTLKLWIYLS